MPRIRQALPADHLEIRDLLTAAFPDEDVVTLVDLVRAGPDHIPELDLVAELDGEVVGHVMASWTPLRSDAGGTRRILMVAPLSVRPDRQRTGIGRALVARLVDLARERSEPVLVLEGDPAYYGRLGFVAAGSLGVQGASPTTPDWAFQVYRIAPDLPDLRGRVVYPEPIWAAEGAGLPEEHRPGGPYPVPWLFALARFSGWRTRPPSTAGICWTPWSRPLPSAPPPGGSRTRWPWTGSQRYWTCDWPPAGSRTPAGRSG
jgi:putative acetyltransferase